MRYAFPLALCIALGASLATLPAASTTMPVSEVRPGMRGVGKTVFEGSTLVDFQVDVIGVLQNVMGPQRNLILARLEGGPLARTGVIAGMSGSPVYIDGRLVGAVSYSLGPFVKDTIAGITPIGEMTDATEVRRRPTAVLQPRAFEDPSEALAAFGRAIADRQAFAQGADDVRAVGLPPADAARLAPALRPIATPLVGSGLSFGASDPLTAVLLDAGFVPAMASDAGGMAAAQSAPTPLRPGDPIGVSLVGGDLSLGATGTITEIDGDRIYAFGHPFFNLGPTAFPMTRAFVHTVLPSYMSSSKLASLGDVIGTMTQDRATAIAGMLGDGPATVPISLTLEADRGLRRTFRYRVVKDQLLTPLLTLISVLNTLQSYERQAGAATFSIKGEARVRGQAPIALDDVFSGDPPSLGAALYVVSPITTLLQNDRAGVDLEGLDVTITSSEQPRTATLERAWLDSPRVRPGQTVGLKVVTRTYRGEETLRTIPISVPASASGTVSLIVSDGPKLAQSEQRDPRRAQQSQSVAQMIRTLNGSRRSNRLYVKLTTPEPGALVHGEALPSLPPSVLAVLEGDRQNGSLRPLGTATLGEWELAVDAMVSGTRTLTINLDNP